jgi:hypothetical protein
MLHTFMIKKIVPWTDFNEHEGQMEGVIDNYDLCCYVQMSGAQEWQEYSPGDIVNADIFLQRLGSVEILDELILPTIKQIKNASYEVTGIATQISGEIILLKSSSPFLLKIDLDISPFVEHLIPEIHVGSQICVQGVIWMDLHPEEE